MRTVSVRRSGKGGDPAPSRSLTADTLRVAVRLADALQSLELPGERLRVGNVESGAHLAGETNHARRRIVEEAKALRAVVRHHGGRVLEVDTCKKALFHPEIAFEGPSKTRA